MKSFPSRIDEHLYELVTHPKVAKTVGEQIAPVAAAALESLVALCCRCRGATSAAAFQSVAKAVPALLPLFFQRTPAFSGRFRSRLFGDAIPLHFGPLALASRYLWTSRRTRDAPLVRGPLIAGRTYE
jgi:hypothetical protein